MGSFKRPGVFGPLDLEIIDRVYEAAWETCGGAPCALGKSLKANGRLTVHVIGYQLRNFRWTGAQSFLDVKCLAEETGGLYITADNRQDLVEAFEKTLGCPMMSAASILLR